MYTRNSKKRGGKLRLVLPGNPPKPEPVLTTVDKGPSTIIVEGRLLVKVGPGVYRRLDG